MALWHTQETFPESLPTKMVGRLMMGAEQQTVSGLVIGALIRQKVGMTEDLYYECIGLIAQIQQSSQRINSELKAFTELMDAGGVQYVVVKGQAAAAYYPDPLLRETGDIDYYCGTTDFDQSLQLLKKQWGVEPEKGDSHYHVDFDYHEVTFEGHFQLTRLYSRRKNAYWQQLLDSDTGAMVNVEGTAVRTLSPTLHTLYVFLHLYHHLLELGIGIRQFCDWAVLLHSCRETIDHEALRHHLQVLGLERAYRACGSILVTRLGLSPGEFTYPVLTSRDHRYGNRIMDVVFYRGNMGKYNKRSGFSGWKHNVEATAIKLSHFLKFMPLAPAFSCRWIAHEVSEKVLLKSGI